MKRILSIDGGGIRGIIPALLLARIERITGRRIASMFDLIAGTSTGGIIALGLTKPGPQGPAYSAGQLASLYSRNGSKIFGRRWKPNLIAPKYAADGLEAVLLDYFGDVQLGSAHINVLVTSYDTERRKPFFFRSTEARQQPDEMFPMRDVARATSAAPTFFPPALIHNNARPMPLSLIDGGVFANNPALCALVDARVMWPDDEYLVVSIGTGNQTKRIMYEDAKDWGLAGWAPRILDVMMDGGPMVVDRQIEMVLNYSSKARRYWRLQPQLEPNHTDMDDASAQNIHALELLAEDYGERAERDISEICEVLAA